MSEIHKKQDHSITIFSRLHYSFNTDTHLYVLCTLSSAAEDSASLIWQNSLET